MILSMTGFGRGTAVRNGREITVELRSVNSRYFEYSSRITRSYSFLDDKVKAYLKEYISRGKVDVFLSIDALEDPETKIELNHSLASGYVKALRELASSYGLQDDVTVSTLARYPDIFMIHKSPEDEDIVWAAVSVALEKALRPFLEMRREEGKRMKADVLRELPPKTENVHRIELDTEQRKLYLAAVVDAREKLRAAKPEDKMAVFAVLMRLRQICCDPRLVADNWSGGSAKLDACMELVTAAVEGGHRILLFSQFTSMLDLLAQRLDEAGVSHFTLQGSTPKPVRAELVRRFNAGEASVFLISLRAGGTGLNLTAADIVIHYDPWWNVAAQNQATDRAYRIGQKNPVQVYKLIAQDTIEEKIVELQQAKQSLADTVTGSADGAILSMKPEELLQLLGEEA